MKRQLACVLAACIGLQLPLGAFNAYGAQLPESAGQMEALEESKIPGLESDSRDEETQTEETEKETIPTASSSESHRQEDEEDGGTETESVPTASPSEPVKPGKEHRGAVMVEIRTLLPVMSAVDFNVELNEIVSKRAKTNEEEDIYQDSLTISLMPEEEPGEGQQEKEIFENVPNGTYELEVTAEGYLPYEQTIEVRDDTSKIMILNDYGDYEYSSSAHPGLIRMGDVDGSGVIDKEDMNALVDAVYEGNLTGMDEEGMDLNRDGEIDLVDLQYFASLYKGKEGSDNKYPVSTIERSITVQEGDVTLASPSEATKSNATKVEGTVQDLFNNDTESSITLEHADSEIDEPISEAYPVELELDLSRQPVIGGIVIQSPPDSEGAISTGEVEAELTDGEKIAVTIDRYAKTEKRRSFRSGATAMIDADGAILIDLKNQKPVKKIRIKVTGTVSEGNLAEISQVEFLGDMKDRIPPPAQNIPQNVSAQIGSKIFTLTWDKEVNITGYEVSITNNGKTEIIETTVNTLTVDEFNGKELLNYETFLVKVRSVNGSWKSSYSAQIAVTPEPDGPPPAPENISIEGGYKSLHISWKKMKDTKSYSLYYRKAGTEDEFTMLGELTGTSTTISGLEDKTEYEIYMVGHNPIGDSPASEKYSGSTITVDAAKMPAYRLINKAAETGEALTEHIKEVSIVAGSITGAPGDVVDGDPLSYWELDDWDAGGVYQNYRGPIITLDQSYEMDTIAFTAGPNQKAGFREFCIRAWDGEGSEPTIIKGRLSARASLDGNGKTYYEFMADEPFTADKVQINVSVPSNQRGISIAEVRFYEYDVLLNEVLSLYTDDLHMTLRGDVTMDTIAELRARADEVDPESGEMTPKRELILKELDNAELILKNEAVQNVIKVDTTVSKAYDKHITFSGGLNGWQPLGTAALAGEQIVVYVGAAGKRPGDNTNLALYATQYHGEASHFQKKVMDLKVGINEIEIPAVSSLGVEKGGALYVEYTGNNPNDEYGVRVIGGSQYPVLDVTRAKTEEERRELIDAYVEEMIEYVPKIEALHNADQDNEKSHYALSKNEYQEKNCILGATDIVLDQVMYSVPIKQVYKSITGNNESAEEAAEKLSQSLTAMDEMVHLFYQHKGLSENPVIGGTTYGKDKLPTTRLNIRYQRMFAGAFMYAGGLHIGIEWDSSTLVGGSVPVKHDNGKYVSGSYFGWGIAHEIGHIINEGAYAVAEVTNNYYSILAQAKDTNDSVRFKYEDAYRKVTSGTKGGSSDQLGMYWQFHLAYDDGYNFKTYEDYEEQRKNLIFARIDSYARDISRAPAPGDVKLTLDGADKDNKLMRLACAAAEKNVLEFFTRWGMTPDAKTKKYAEQFDAEERAIYYINDEAREYRAEGGSSIADSVEVTATAQQDAADPSRVTLTMEASGKDGAAMSGELFGYEITRIQRRYGKEERQVVGFTQENTFTDVISGINNRVVGYEVRGIDWCMMPTEAYVLADEILVSHDGSMDKTGWSITVNTLSKADEEVNGDVNSEENQFNQSCSGTISSAKIMIDNDLNTAYEGTVNAAEDAEQKAEDAQAVISLGRTEAIAGVKYTYKGTGEPIKRYSISISEDGTDWKEIKKGTFQLKDGVTTVHFDKENDGKYYIYDAAYVKITALDSNRFAATEIDILSPVGDSVWLDQFGILAEDAVFEHSGSDNSGEDSTATSSSAKRSGRTATGSNATRIPKGSIVFTGRYKGNPAYNMVILYDEKGNVVGGKDKDGDTVADQLILAPDPKDGQLGEVSEGSWIYYIEPEYLNGFEWSEKVRAELYRVQDAETNEGDRLVSDTKLISVPNPIPTIKLENSQTPNNGE